MSIEDNFREFLSEIEPGKTHIHDAKSGHETLRQRLESDEEIRASLAGDTFLSGFYRRRTAVRPVKDVDIIVPLEYVAGLKPRTCLEKVRRILTKYYKAPNLENQRRSIRVDLSYVTMDIVPALAPEGTDGSLLIPDRNQALWLESHPKAHIKWTEQLNKSSKEMYVPLVKALKWWRQTRLGEIRHPKSFFLECMTAKDVDFKANSIRELFHGVLEGWRRRFGPIVDAGRIPNLEDPGLPGETLATGMTVEEFKSFYEEVGASEEIARNALQKDDARAAAREWQKLFGPEFPLPDTGATTGVSKTALGQGYFVKVIARLAPWKNALVQEHYPSGGRSLPKDWWLRFEIVDLNVPEPYQIKWIVENHGVEATRAGDLGHLTFPGTKVQWEETKYIGQHYMYCDIIKDGDVIAGTRHVVKIR